MTKNTRKSVFYILVFLFLVNILAWIAVFELSKPQFLEVIFFDIGQGDAIFIETPQRHQILIDGGPSSIILEKLGKEMPFWDKSIDLMILTHPERDHLAGLIEVWKEYKVENILWTGVIRDTAEFKEWQNLIEEEKAKVFIAQSGQKITATRTVLEVLYPFERLAGKELKNSNDTSIVNRLFFGKRSFLFSGDISKSVEKELVGQYSVSDLGGFATLDSDVLKIAHHGSKTSSFDEFLEKVSPEIAVIQVGEENPYGHPHPEVLERLENFGIKVLRTDLQTDIKILSDGKNLKFQFSNPNFQSSSN